MTHSERIIERSITVWSEWLGRRIMTADGAALPRDVHLQEIRIEFSENSHPYFLGWQQEDGMSDDILFHWLSVQRVSHFTENCLAARAFLPDLGRIEGSIVQRVELYGDKDVDAIVAAIIKGDGATMGVATARKLTNGDRFSHFGISDLIVTNEEAMRQELSRQSVGRIIELDAAVT